MRLSDSVQEIIRPISWDEFGQFLTKKVTNPTPNVFYLNLDHPLDETKLIVVHIVEGKEVLRRIDPLIVVCYDHGESIAADFRAERAFRRSKKLGAK